MELKRAWMRFLRNWARLGEAINEVRTAIAALKKRGRLVKSEGRWSTPQSSTPGGRVIDSGNEQLHDGAIYHCAIVLRLAVVHRGTVCEVLPAELRSLPQEGRTKRTEEYRPYDEAS